MDALGGASTAGALAEARDIVEAATDAAAEILKQAALEARAALEEYPGISRARDDLFYNKQELLLEVKRGEALGFTNAMIGNLTRANLKARLPNALPAKMKK